MVSFTAMLRMFTMLALCMAVVLGTVAYGAVKPNSLFSDGAVLLRGVKVPIWGTANDGEKVVVEFCGQKASTIANDGKWMV